MFRSGFFIVLFFCHLPGIDDIMYLYQSAMTKEKKTIMEWRIAIVDDLKMDRERLEKDVARWYAKQELEAETYV